VLRSISRKYEETSRCIYNYTVSAYPKPQLQSISFSAQCFTPTYHTNIHNTIVQNSPRSMSHTAAEKSSMCQKTDFRFAECNKRGSVQEQPNKSKTSAKFSIHNALNFTTYPPEMLESVISPGKTRPSFVYITHPPVSELQPACTVVNQKKRGSFSMSVPRPIHYHVLEGEQTTK
jgi:hypothetical protein